MSKNNKKIFWLATFLIIFLFSSAGFWYFKTYDKPEYEHKGFFPLMTLKPIWERKIKTTQDLKIGLITDTHIHPERIIRDDKREEAPRKLKDKDMIIVNSFIKQMEEFMPNFVVHLGDVVEGTGDPTNVTIAGLKLFKAEFDRMGVPIYWLIGNHDLRSMQKSEFQEALGVDHTFKVFDQGDYRIIILDTNYDEFNAYFDYTKGNEYIRGHLPPKILVWLEEELKTEKQVLVFMHQGPFEEAVEGEFNGKIRLKQSIDNASELNLLLKKYHALAVFNGHMEAKVFKKQEGISYYSLLGTEKNRSYQGSYYELEVNAGEPQMNIFYADSESGEYKREKF